MSFTINAQGTSKSDVKAQVETKMAEIVAQQDSHQRDRDYVLSAVDMYMSIIDPNEGDTISVSISGSVGWENRDPSKPNTDASERRFTGAGLSISVRCYKNA